MATNYRKAKYPVRPWRPRDHTRFAEVLDSLKWESCPNGNCGWEDRAAQKFVDAGFVVKAYSHGNPHVMSIVTIDISG